MTTELAYHPRKYISYSTLISFIRCPRSYFYNKCGVTPKAEPTALVYGSAMHKAVPYLFTDGGLDAAVTAFKSVWDDSLADPKHSTTRAIAQLGHFLYTHSGPKGFYKLIPPPANNHITLADDVNEFEIPFVIDVGLPVPIFGRIDGWARDNTGKLWAWEFKTASYLTSALTDSLEFNPQVLTYALVCSTYTQEKVHGVIFEAMLKNDKKVDNLAQPVPVQDHLLKDITTWLKYWGSLLLACEERLLNQADKLDPANSFPKNFAGCTSYPLFYKTGSPCDYMSLCRQPDWKSLLAYYDIRPEHTPLDLTIGATDD